MNRLFEELDRCRTDMGALSLRRRRLIGLDIDVFEVMLNDEHLMSSLFTEGEQALARIALERASRAPLDVAVAGLGLGYTAAAALEDPRVACLTVVEVMAPVLEWFARGMVPLSGTLTDDPRCRLLQADFFERLRLEPGHIDPDHPSRRFDVLLVDIDHSPRHVLDDSHAAFYEPAGLKRAASVLKPHGVFALWSNDPPDAEFQDAMRQTFDQSQAEVVRFHNPLTDGFSSCTIYIGRSAG